jgi:hypothetical protein
MCDVDDFRQRLRRAPTVVVLDTVLNALGSTRRRVDALRQPPRPGRRAVAAGIAAAVAVPVIGSVTLVVMVLRSPEGLLPLTAPMRPASTVEEPPGGTAPSPPPSAAAEESTSPRPPTSSTGSELAVPPSATGAPVGPAVPATLTARYAKQETGGSLLGYRASVTINNSGAVPVAGWTMTITLPRRTLTISDVSGASARQQGATWTFTPDSGTVTVPGHRSVLVSFQVNGAAVAADPVACTIGGRRCDGLSDQHTAVG